MKQDWEILKLGGYLEEVQFPPRLPAGTTFSKTFEATNKLPDITVGLGIIGSQGGSFSVQAVPPIKHSPKVLLNTFINEVAEQYLKLSEQTENWQELLLMGLGYAKKLNHGAFSINNYVLFAGIPEEERLFLLNKYGFHKVATIVAYGQTDNIDQILQSLDALNKEFPEDANYGSVMALLQAGVPVEELSVAVQLPLEMALEIYCQDS